MNVSKDWIPGKNDDLFWCCVFSLLHNKCMLMRPSQLPYDSHTAIVCYCNSICFYWLEHDLTLISQGAGGKCNFLRAGPGSAATLPQDQLRPYPCQGSAATLPTRILWKGQRFLPLSRVSCDPTWLQCKESYKFLHCFEVIQVQVQHSFYQFSPPPWQPMLCDPTWQHSFYQIFPPLGNPCFQWFKFKYNILFIKIFTPPWQPMLCDPTWQHSFYQISPPLPTHAFNDSSSSTTFLLSNFPPLGNPCFQWFKFKYNIPFINFSSPWQTMLCDPTWQHSFYQIFPPLGNPCFQWFKFKYNIPFIKIFPLLGNPCFATLPDNIPFIKFSPPLATHAFNDSSSSTTFLLSKFCPPPPLGKPCFATLPDNISFIKFSLAWQPTLSMIQVQVQHSWYQKFSPPLGKPCFATLPDNIPFIKFSLPLGNPCFQWFKFKYNIPFIKIFHPPLATRALRPYLTTFLLSNFPPPWQPMLCDPTWQHSPRPPGQPMLSMIQVQLQHSFYQKFSPPWQPVLCDPTWQHSFYQIFPPLGNPCFQWFKFKYNIPFIKILPPPPPWQTMLCDPTWQHSPPLATHAFNDSSSSTTFLLSKFFTPPWQPVLCDPTWQHSFFPIFPPLATHAFNDSCSSTTFLLSLFSAYPGQTMLCDPTWQHSFYQIFPPLGNPCFQWFKFKYNIPFIKILPPLGKPCFATLPDNIPFIKFSPPLATHAFNDSSSSTTFLLSKFRPPPWQPVLCDPTWQHSFYILLSNFPPPPWPPMLCDPTWQHSFPSLTHAFNDSSSSTTFLLSNFSPSLANHALRPYLTTFLLSKFSPPLATHAFNDSSSSTTFLLSKFSAYPGQTMLCDLPDDIPFVKFSPPLSNPCFQWFKFKYNIPFILNFSPPWQPMLCNPTWQHSFYQIFLYNMSAMSHLVHLTMQPCVPKYLSHPCQLLFQSTMPNRGRAKQHTIQPHVASKPTNAQARHAVKEQPASQHHAKKPEILFWDPTQLLFPINSSEHRSGHTTHHIQPNIASKHANAPPRYAVKEPPETSQRHAKHQSYSAATLPNYCFPSTIPTTGRVTQHTIYSQT